MLLIFCSSCSLFSFFNPTLCILVSLCFLNPSYLFFVPVCFLFSAFLKKLSLYLQPAKTLPSFLYQVYLESTLGSFSPYPLTPVCLVLFLNIPTSLFCVNINLGCIWIDVAVKSRMPETCHDNFWFHWCIDHVCWSF